MDDHAKNVLILWGPLQTANIEIPLRIRIYPVHLDGFPRYLYLRLSKTVGTLSDDAYIISLDQNFFKKTT